MDAMQRANWLEWRRRNGFGGSDAPAVVGLSKFKSTTQLVLEKRGEIPPDEDTEFFHWRREMEDPILREYGRRTGNTVVRPNEPVKSRDHPWMFTTYDGVVLSGVAMDTPVARVVQAKTANSKEGWGDPGSDDVPDEYWIQVQHEMAVCGAPVADIPVLFFFNKLAIFTVEADVEFQRDLIEAERSLWAMVQSGEMPPVTSVEDAKARWGRASKLGRTIADESVRNAVAELKKVAEESAQLELRENAAKLIIMTALGENETLVTPDGEILLTWKAQGGKAGVHREKLEAEFPEAYRACFKRGEPFRKMLVK